MLILSKILPNVACIIGIKSMKINNNKMVVSIEWFFKYTIYIYIYTTTVLIRNIPGLVYNLQHNRKIPHELSKLLFKGAKFCWLIVAHINENLYLSKIINMHHQNPSSLRAIVYDILHNVLLCHIYHHEYYRWNKLHDFLLNYYRWGVLL